MGFPNDVNNTERTMNIVNRIGRLAVHGPQTPITVILHDTAGPTLSGAEDTLVHRGLGYHYMIDKDGTIYQYASPHRMMWHAGGFNRNTIGISFVGGYKYGEINEGQMQAVIQLINEELKPNCPDLTQITGHKHASRLGKVDPRFPGEPPEGINKAIDRKYMLQFQDETGLEFVKFTSK